MLKLAIFGKIFENFGNGKAELIALFFDFLSLSTFQKNYNTLKSTVNTSTSSSIQLQNIPGNIRRYSFQTQQPNSGIYFYFTKNKQAWKILTATDHWDSNTYRLPEYFSDILQE